MFICVPQVGEGKSLPNLLHKTSKGLAKFCTPPETQNGDFTMEAAALTKDHRPDDFSF